MKYTLAVSLFAITALAVPHPHHVDNYNASGIVTFTGYDLSTFDDAVPTRWTIEERITHSEHDESVWLNMMLRDDRDQIQNTAEGWYLHQAIITLDTRTSTAPVAGDCSSVLSKECIEGIKAMRCTDPGSATCDSLSRIRSCRLPGGGYGFGNSWQSLQKTEDGAWHAAGLGSIPHKDPKKVLHEYDTWMSYTFLSAIIWHRQGIPESQQLDSTPLCTTISYVKPGSRGLQEAIESVNPPSSLAVWLWAAGGLLVMGGIAWWLRRRHAIKPDNDEDSSQPLLA